MSQVDPKWYLLCILVLVIGVLTLPGIVAFPTYSQEDAYELCSRVFFECQSLANSNASEADWQQFEQRALPELKAIAQDHEKFRKHRTAATSLHYQIARYNIPEAIQKRGKIPEKDIKSITQLLAAAHQAIHAPPPRPAPRQPNAKPGNHEGWDPVIVTIIVGDILIAVGGGVFWFWRT